MIQVLFVFVALVLGVGTYCLAALPFTGWRRWIAPPLLGLLYAAVLLGGAQVLGRAKPAWLGLPAAREVEVIAAAYNEPVAIYVWCREAGSLEPRAYVLPWREMLAAELHQALRASEEDGVPVMLKLPLGPWSPAVPAMPYPAPQPPLPLKQGG